MQTLERWIALRLETIGALVVLCTACMAVWQHSQLYVGVAALVLYRASSLTGVLNFTVRSAVECENQLTAVERLLEYVATLPSEAEFTKEADEAVATTWPERGDVRFQDVHMRYREGLEPALRGVTAFISGAAASVLKYSSEIGRCDETPLLFSDLYFAHVPRAGA